MHLPSSLTLTHVVGPLRGPTRMVLASVGAIGSGVAVALWPLPVLAVAVGVTGVACLVFMRPWALLVAAACVACLLPLEAVSSPTWIRQIPVGMLPIAAVLLRTHVAGPIRIIPLVIAGAGTTWVVASLVLSGPVDVAGAIRSAFWAATLIVCVFAASTGARSFERRETVENAMLAILTGLAIGAMIESFGLRSNPAFDWLYHSGSTPIVQKWAGYRATTTLGHPLVNGLAFSTGLVLCLGRLMSGPRYTRWVLIACAVALAGGLVASQSRGAMLAVAMGVALLVLSKQRGAAGIRRKVVIGVAIATAAVVATTVLGGRLASDEAKKSTADRAALPSLVRSAMADNQVTGAGPGQASASIDRTGAIGNNGSDRLESALGELLVGIGWPGTLLVLIALARVAARGLRSPETAGAAAASVALFVAACGFNALEGHPKIFVLLGILVILSQRPPAETGEEPDRTLRGRVRVAKLRAIARPLVVSR